jgi:hypothetical protein
VLGIAEALLPTYIELGTLITVLGFSELRFLDILCILFNRNLPFTAYIAVYVPKDAV